MESPCTMRHFQEDLHGVLGNFVAEVRKEGQKEYPGKTLYEVICCIQAYFRIER